MLGVNLRTVLFALARLMILFLFPPWRPLLFVLQHCNRRQLILLMFMMFMLKTAFRFFPLQSAGTPPGSAKLVSSSAASRLKHLQQSSLERKNRKQREDFPKLQQGQQQVFHF